MAHHGQGDERAHILHPGQRHSEATARLLQGSRNAGCSCRDLLGLSGDPGASAGHDARSAAASGAVRVDEVWHGEKMGTR